MPSEPTVNGVVDITPTPKILRTLGDIPFELWQCFAELIDNAIDAFANAERKGSAVNEPTISIDWSSDLVAHEKKEITIVDNGPGMNILELTNAVKAGYSGNDPFATLGLFGMGFNISTAKLGEETILYSTQKGDKAWLGISINFENLIKNQTFKAPIVRADKSNIEESGTRIIIRNLKSNAISDLRKRESGIRKQLEGIYTPLLSKKTFSIYIQNKILNPRPHCVWSKSRFVVKGGQKIFAVQNIDRDLGDTWFDADKNRYLTEEECDHCDMLLRKEELLPSNIIKRARRLKGWLGIQRYGDTSDFGVDFVRNGRKILIKDKSLFSYMNVHTGTLVPEYPVDLGTTYGGRIVGELYVDYLVPTYQKNAFEKNDVAWRLTVEAVRGAGPMIPKTRKALNYDGDNNSPLGKLFHGYRRPEAGTKNLVAPNAKAKEFAEKYYAGELEYLEDDKWYRLAQETDRLNSEGGKSQTHVDQGDEPSDEVGSYLNGGNEVPGIEVVEEIGESITADRTLPYKDELIACSTIHESLSGLYAYDNKPGLQVKAYRINSDKTIKVYGRTVPCYFSVDGVEVDYFFDSNHPIISEYPITPKYLLIQLLTKQFSVRDKSISYDEVFYGLVENHLGDERINKQALQERAQNILDSIRDRMPALLKDHFHEAMSIVQEVESEIEELFQDLLKQAPDLFDGYLKFKKAQKNNSLPFEEPTDMGSNFTDVLSYLQFAPIKRLVEKMPEAFFDGKLLTLPYSSIDIDGISNTTAMRLKNFTVAIVTSYITDMQVLLSSVTKIKKSELLRFANTIILFEGYMVE